jgi:hypothetical protein
MIYYTFQDKTLCISYVDYLCLTFLEKVRLLEPLMIETFGYDRADDDEELSDLRGFFEAPEWLQANNIVRFTHAGNWLRHGAYRARVYALNMFAIKGWDLRDQNKTSYDTGISFSEFIGLPPISKQKLIENLLEVYRTYQDDDSDEIRALQSLSTDREWYMMGSEYAPSELNTQDYFINFVNK